MNERLRIIRTRNWRFKVQRKWLGLWWTLHVEHSRLRAEGRVLKLADDLRKVTYTEKTYFDESGLATRRVDEYGTTTWLKEKKHAPFFERLNQKLDYSVNADPSNGMVWPC